MSAMEIAHRAKRALRKRFFPSRYTRISAEQAFHWFFGDAEPSLPIAPPGLRDLFPRGAESLADALTVDLFGHCVTLDDPPNWRKNYAHGGEWPDESAHALDLRRIDIAGGVKYVWEPSRHHFIARAAYLFAQTGEDAYAEKVAEWLEDWVDKNSVDRGIHWTSALEMAVRIVVWTWCLTLVPRLPGRVRRKALGSLAQQAAHIEENLSYGSSANNHLIGEACALAFFGQMWPTCRASQRWKRLGLRIAETECLRQILPDGVPGEQTFGYMPFVWEFYLHLGLAGIELRPETKERLGRSVDFIDCVATSEGYVPQVGDEDDGCVLCRRAGWGRFGIVAEAMRKLFGTPPLGACCRPGVVQFKEGGYTVFHAEEPEMCAVFDHGPLGLGSLAAHGHADALSLTMCVRGKPVLVDPGVYAYHEAPKWRDYFRGTSAHNTMFFGENQSEILGPFLWGRKAAVEKTESGYRVRSPLYAATHGRVVTPAPGMLHVVDSVGEAGLAHWHFHPSVEVAHVHEKLVEARIDGETVLALRFDEPLDMEIVHGVEGIPGPGWYSPGFGRLEPCATLVVHVPAGTHRVSLVFSEA